MTFHKGQIVRVFAKKNGAQLWDAIVAKVGSTWVGLRPKPAIEDTEGGDRFTTNFNQDSYELFPIDSPVFSFSVQHAS